MRTIVIGIDISAKTLDICLKTNDSKEFLEIANTSKDIKKLLKRYKKCSECVMIAMENTGKYNNHLYEVLASKDFKVFVIHPYHLKKSLGLSRGKNDKIDAERIASFVEKNYNELPLWKPCSKAISTLKVLATERKTTVKTRTRLKQKQKDYQYIEDKTLRNKLSKINSKALKQVNQQIKEIQQLINSTILEDSKTKQQMELIKSIPGVGDVVALAVLTKTEGFTLYNCPRKLACCAGVVPFRYQSGTSINSKAKVSQLADKSLKTLLNMAALRAVRMDNDLKKYYDRKVNEGKNKMSVLNAVRNKIVHIIYAVIKNQKLYQNRLVLS